MNTPVSFELAKLLKEKGFDEQNLTIYQDGEVLLLRSTISNSQFMTSRNYTAPTIAEVVMWLYEKHEIQLFLDYTYYDGFHYGVKWVKYNGDYGQIWRDNNGEIADGYDSWTEAYEAAIEYIFKTLLP